MSKPILPRSTFLLSGLSLAALSACGGPSVAVPAPRSGASPFSPSEIYDLMRKVGIEAFWENGVMTALPESKYSGGGTGGKTTLDCANPTPQARIHGMFCATAQATPSPTLYNAYYVDGPYTMLGSDSGSFGLQGGYNGGFGPIYEGPEPPKNCVAETLVALGTIAQSILAWVQANGGQIAKDAGFWTSAFAAGEITAAEFITALFAALASWEVLAILAGIGVAAGSIWLLYKCLSGA